MKTVFIDNRIIGEEVNPCKSSNYLYNKCLNFFHINNYTITDDFKEADYIVLNTCPASDTFKTVYIENIRKYRAENKKVKSINVIGCGSIKKSDFLDLIDDIIPIKKEHLFDELYEHTVPYNSMDNYKIGLSFSQQYDDGSYCIEISQGCIHNCTYCGIKKGIGYVKSRTIEDISDEIKFALSQGYTKISFINHDFGSYGLDIGTNFAEFLDQILAISDKFQISIGAMEPGQCIKYFEGFKKNLHRVYALEIPVQSLNDRILKLMGRNYTTEQYYTLIKDIRKYNPKIILTSHIIFCYPTETREEFLNNFNKEYTSLINTTIFNLYTPIEGKKSFEADEHITGEEFSFRTSFLKKICALHPGRLITFLFEKDEHMICGILAKKKLGLH